jgi:hypothetical protein
MLKQPTSELCSAQNTIEQLPNLIELYLEDKEETILVTEEQKEQMFINDDLFKTEDTRNYFSCTDYLLWDESSEMWYEYDDDLFFTSDSNKYYSNKYDVTYAEDTDRYYEDNSDLFYCEDRDSWYESDDYLWHHSDGSYYSYEEEEEEYENEGYDIREYHSTYTANNWTKKAILLYIELRNHLISSMCEYDTTDLSFTNSSTVQHKQDLLDSISYLLFSDYMEGF